MWVWDKNPKKKKKGLVLNRFQHSSIFWQRHVCTDVKVFKRRRTVLKIGKNMKKFA